jgi:hypothetical protein
MTLTEALTAALTATLMALPGAASVSAHDHGNLDVGRPLRIEDAYTVAEGEVVLETGAAFVDERQGSDRAELPIELIWGAAPDVQLELGTRFSTDPHEVRDPQRSGDTQVGVLFNLNRESLDTPAFALKAEVNLPTGTDSAGADLELKGIVTRTIDRLGIHASAGYHFLSGEPSEERDGRYELVLGASQPLGAPMDTRTTLLADVYLEQAPEQDDDEILGVELGTRHQLSQRTVLDVGVGSEVDGPSDRDRLRLTAGFSISF